MLIFDALLLPWIYDQSYRTRIVRNLDNLFTHHRFTWSECEKRERFPKNGMGYDGGNLLINVFIIKF